MFAQFRHKASLFTDTEEVLEVICRYWSM